MFYLKILKEILFIYINIKENKIEKKASVLLINF
jgi:hypothetical protein